MDSFEFGPAPRTVSHLGPGCVRHASPAAMRLPAGRSSNSMGGRARQAGKQPAAAALCATRVQSRIAAPGPS
jgi:hypothetical protein